MDKIYKVRPTANGKYEVVEAYVSDSGHTRWGEVVDTRYTERAAEQSAEDWNSKVT